MVTEISGAGLGLSVTGQLGATAPPRVAESARPDASDARTAAVANGESGSASARVAGLYAKLLVRQDALNQSASVVREVGVTVEKADQLLGKMEEELDGVVKMYPPYPIDNPERVSLLNSVAGLRRQVDALTFPPPETLEALGRLLGSREDADAQGVGGAEQASALSLVKEPMWDIPALDPLAASDEEVGKALDQVQAMRSILEDLQSGMWKDVVGFVQQADSAEAQDDAAAGLRERLADIGNRGIGANARQLEQAAES